MFGSPDEVSHVHTHKVLGVREHPDVGQKALEQLIPFASSYLCEAFFSTMTDHNKANKQTVPGEVLDHSSFLPATKIRAATDQKTHGSDHFSDQQKKKRKKKKEDK